MFQTTNQVGKGWKTLQPPTVLPRVLQQVARHLKVVVETESCAAKNNFGCFGKCVSVRCFIFLRGAVWFLLVSFLTASHFGCIHCMFIRTSLERSNAKNEVTNLWPTSWWFQPLWKIWKSVGMMKFPILMGKCQKWQPNHQPENNLREGHLGIAPPNGQPTADLGMKSFIQSPTAMKFAATPKQKNTIQPVNPWFHMYDLPNSPCCFEAKNVACFTDPWPHGGPQAVAPQALLREIQTALQLAS